MKEKEMKEKLKKINKGTKFLKMDTKSLEGCVSSIF